MHLLAFIKAIKKICLHLQNKLITFCLVLILPELILDRRLIEKIKLMDIKVLDLYAFFVCNLF